MFPDIARQGCLKHFIHLGRNMETPRARDCETFIDDGCYQILFWVRHIAHVFMDPQAVHVTHHLVSSCHV